MSFTHASTAQKDYIRRLLIKLELDSITITKLNFLVGFPEDSIGKSLDSFLDTCERELAHDIITKMKLAVSQLND